MLHLRNEFTIEKLMQDGTTEYFKAYNIVTNYGKGRLCSGKGYSNSISLGCGSGVPAVTDTSLFNHLGTYSGTITYANEGDVAKTTITYTLSESTLVNTDITEIGIGSSGSLYTHAMFTDALGQPITIHKGENERMRIVAIAYLSVSSFSDETVVNMHPITDYIKCGNDLLNKDLFFAACYTPVLSNGVSLPMPIFPVLPRDAYKYSYVESSKSITASMSLSSSSYNGFFINGTATLTAPSFVQYKNGTVFMRRDHFLNICFINKSKNSTDVLFNVGIGDGVTNEYALPFKLPANTKVVVTVDGESKKYTTKPANYSQYADKNIITSCSQYNEYGDIHFSTGGARSTYEEIANDLFSFNEVAQVLKASDHSVSLIKNKSARNIQLAGSPIEGYIRYIQLGRFIFIISTTSYGVRYKEGYIYYLNDNSNLIEVTTFYDLDLGNMTSSILSYYLIDENTIALSNNKSYTVSNDKVEVNDYTFISSLPFKTISAGIDMHKGCIDGLTEITYFEAISDTTTNKCVFNAKDRTVTKELITHGKLLMTDTARFIDYENKIVLYVSQNHGGGVGVSIRYNTFDTTPENLNTAGYINAAGTKCDHIVKISATEYAVACCSSSGLASYYMCKIVYDPTNKSFSLVKESSWYTKSNLSFVGYYVDIVDGMLLMREGILMPTEHKVVFDEAPAEGAVIKCSYPSDYIYKNEDWKFDALSEIGIQ